MNGDLRAITRLRTLVESHCIRRTKKDDVNGKPLVPLPKKSIEVRELDFNDEERTRKFLFTLELLYEFRSQLYVAFLFIHLVYEAFQENAQRTIQRLLDRGGNNNLLRHWGHIFAIMMRLRQMCCHRVRKQKKIANIDFSFAIS